MANFTHHITGEHFERYAKPVKYTTKHGHQLWNNYIHAYAVELSEVYDNYSEEKEQAYESIQTLFMCAKDSIRFRICSKNTFQFSVAFCYANVEADGFKHYYLLYFTRDNTYIVEITDKMYEYAQICF